jgi:hypothetical protein
MFVGTYIGQLSQSGWYAVPAIVVGAAVLRMSWPETAPLAVRAPTVGVLPREASPDIGGLTYLRPMDFVPGLWLEGSCGTRSSRPCSRRGIVCQHVGVGRWSCCRRSLSMAVATLSGATSGCRCPPSSVSTGQPQRRAWVRSAS